MPATRLATVPHSVRLPTYETRRDDGGEAVRLGPVGAG